MDEVEIYYFSGSGNSFAVARGVAMKLGADLTPIMSVMGEESIKSDAGIVGFVFPIYDFKPPKFMDEFVSKIENIESKKIFAVCTYGIAPSKSLKEFESTINSHNGHLSLGFAVEMPQCGLGSGTVSEIQQETMFRNWKDRVDDLCDEITDMKTDKIETTNQFFNFLNPRIIKALPILFKFMYYALIKGLDSFAFTSNENCTGCGTCEKICSQNNIELIDNKPSWSDHCINCFACINWCPNGAITLGSVDMGIRNYHHPDVKISDMIIEEK